MVMNLPALQETWFDLWAWGIPWRREWLPTPVFLPGESHGQRSLRGYSPRGHEGQTREHTCAVPLPRWSSQEQDEGNFRDGADSGVCELRPRHGGYRSFQNTQGALGRPGHLCFQAQLSGLPSWSRRSIKGQLPLLFLVGSLPARPNSSHPGVTLLSLVLALPSGEDLSVCPSSQLAFLIIRMGQVGHRLEGQWKCPCQPGLT